MPLAVVRTNVSRGQVPKNFMRNFSAYISQEYGYDEQLMMVEAVLDVPMIRGDSTDPMATVEFHHSDDRIREDSKRQVAQKLAQFLAQTLEIKVERILVLFFDTRLSTIQSTDL